MEGSYTIQPGDFLISSYQYNNNKVFAIFEGKEIYSTTYVSAKPDYTLLAHYEAKPYSYTGGVPQPVLEIATADKPCSRKIYIIENPTSWKKCSEEEKAEFIDILLNYGYIWDEDTWSLIKADTGEIINSIIKPKFEYNGAPCKAISDAAIEVLTQKSKHAAQNIYMADPPVMSASYQHTPGRPSCVHDSYAEYGYWE